MKISFSEFSTVTLCLETLSDLFGECHIYECLECIIYFSFPFKSIEDNGIVLVLWLGESFTLFRFKKPFSGF